MKIKQTANAGVLLSLDNTDILLDGVCKHLPPYEGTPDDIRDELIKSPPDAVFFTHRHDDHFDNGFAELYKMTTLRPVIGPELSVCLTVGNLRISPVKTRHLGKNNIEHTSFIIESSSCVWFAGDASPSELKDKTSLPSPDVLIVPFAYANTETAWRITKSLGAGHIIIVHIPNSELDEFNILSSVKAVIKSDSSTHISKIGETFTFF